MIGPLKPECLRNLEDEAQRKLQAAGVVGGDRLAEERRSDVAHEILPVDVVKKVKDISGNFKFSLAMISS